MFAACFQRTFTRGTTLLDTLISVTCLISMQVVVRRVCSRFQPGVLHSVSQESSVTNDDALKIICVATPKLPTLTLTSPTHDCCRSCDQDIFMYSSEEKEKESASRSLNELNEVSVGMFFILLSNTQIQQVKAGGSALTGVHAGPLTISC